MPFKKLIESLSGFARFQSVDAVRISDSLAFVGIGLAEPVQLGRNLSELLLVDPRKRKRKLILIDRSFRIHTFSFRFDPIRKDVFNRMRIAEGKMIFFAWTSAL